MDKKRKQPSEEAKQKQNPTSQRKVVEHTEQKPSKPKRVYTPPPPVSVPPVRHALPLFGGRLSYLNRRLQPLLDQMVMLGSYAEAGRQETLRQLDYLRFKLREYADVLKENWDDYINRGKKLYQR